MAGCVETDVDCEERTDLTGELIIEIAAPTTPGECLEERGLACEVRCADPAYACQLGGAAEGCGEWVLEAVADTSVMCPITLRDGAGNVVAEKRILFVRKESRSSCGLVPTDTIAQELDRITLPDE